MVRTGKRTGTRSQSSLELLVTVSFGLVILLPVVALAFAQMSTSTFTLAATEAQEAANKIAAAATQVGLQGAPAKQAIAVQVPQNVQSIYVGNLTNGVGHEIVFVVNTNNGADYVTAYTPVNVSGNLFSIESQATYLVNVSAVSSCPSKAGVPCVYVQKA